MSNKNVMERSTNSLSTNCVYRMPVNDERAVYRGPSPGWIVFWIVSCVAAVIAVFKWAVDRLLEHAEKQAAMAHELARTSIESARVAQIESARIMSEAMAKTADAAPQDPVSATSSDILTVVTFLVLLVLLAVLFSKTFK